MTRKKMGSALPGETHVTSGLKSRHEQPPSYHDLPVKIQKKIDEIAGALVNKSKVERAFCLALLVESSAIGILRGGPHIPEAGAQMLAAWFASLCNKRLDEICLDAEE